MPQETAGSAKYAIFRTRVQPYSRAHEWAIETFRLWAGTEHVFGAKRLIVAIVDPSLNINKWIKQQYVRLRPEMNPYSDWQTLHMAHTRRCMDQSDREPRCEDITITRIPSLVDLALRREKARAIARELHDRLPLGDGSVWYFPCFDHEDSQDIQILWDMMRDTRKRKALLPRMPVVVSYHDNFVNYLTEQAPIWARGRPLGVYAAALLRLAGIEVIGTTLSEPIVQEGLSGESVERIHNSLRAIFDDTKLRPLTRHQVGVELPRIHDELLGEGWESELSFLPPDPTSKQLQEFLVRDVLHAIKDQVGPTQLTLYEKILGPYETELEEVPLMPTESGARATFAAVVQAVQETELKGRVRKDLVPNLQHAFEALSTKEGQP